MEKGKAMGVYVTLGALDSEVSHAFYDAVLAVLGWRMTMEFPGWRAYAEENAAKDGFTLWICQPFDGAPARAGNGTMVGFPAKSRAEVEAFHAAAMAHGGIDEGAPGLRPHYGPNWYAAYLRDPSGNKLAAVFNG